MIATSTAALTASTTMLPVGRVPARWPRPTIRPLTIEPATNPSSAIALFRKGMPGTPTSANPRKSTLPVMLPVKTRSRPRYETASTTPVEAVNSSSASTERRVRSG